MPSSPWSWEGGHPALAVLVGAASWGLDLVSARVRTGTAEAASAPAGVPNESTARTRRSPPLRHLVVGLVVLGPPWTAAQLRALRARAKPAWAVAQWLAQPALHLPPVRTAPLLLQHLQARLARAAEITAA